MGPMSGRPKNMLRPEDVEAILAEAAHRTKPVEVGPAAMRAITRAINAVAREFIDFLLREPEAGRIAERMRSIVAAFASLRELLQFRIKPIYSPRHGSPEEIDLRVEKREKALYTALARTAGAGSLVRGTPALQRVVDDFEKIAEKLVSWASATELEHVQVLIQLQTRVVGDYRQGDHRSTRSHALEHFVFGALGAYERNIGKPGTAAPATLDGPAVRYLEAIFRALREKIADETELVSSRVLSPERKTLAYLIRRYNENNR
jgi:hypothetical protein